MLTWAFNIQLLKAEPSTLPVPDDSAAIQATINAGSTEPPPTEWNRTYGGVNEEAALDVVQTMDGGYALAGYTSSFGAGSWDFWLVRTDGSGYTLWNRTYGGPNYDEAYSLVQTGDGGFALAGYTFSFGAGSQDFWLVRTDGSGNVLWSKTYGGSGNESAYSLVQTSDGGYAMAGSTTPFGAGISDAWLVKTDASGSVQWNKTYGGMGNDEARSVVQTSDGGFAMAGCTSFLPGTGLDYWLVRTDKSGNDLWNKTYDRTSADGAYSLVQTSDGGFAMAGYTWELWSDTGIDFWLVRTDGSGNALWNKTYDRSSGDLAYSLVLASDGGFAMAGHSASLAGDQDYWLVKTDESGNALWNKTYGGPAKDDAYSLVQTGDGGFALAGYTFSFGAGNYDLWLVKLGAGAPEEWSFAIITDLHIGRGYPNYNGEDYYLTDRLQRVVKWISDNAAADNIKFVVVLGDITEDGTQAEMQKANEKLAGLGEIPYFPVMGNHDHTSTLTGAGQDDRYFDSVFNTTFFNAQHAKLGAGCTRWVDERKILPGIISPDIHLENYAFEYRGKNLVLLDFVDRATILGMPKLETQTMDFLREQLNQAGPTILFSHHPLIKSLSNFHIGITGADTWTDLDGNITSASATVLANFAGHVHGYYDPNLPNYFSPQDFADAEQALHEQEKHPTLKLKTPQFYNASYNYKGSQFATAGDISVMTTEAMMVGSNTNTKNGIVRIVKVTEDSFDTWTPEDTAFPSLNPYIISATTSGVHLSGNDVDFQVYAFAKMFSTEHPIEYSLYVDGELRERKYSSAVERVKFEDQTLSRGTHEVNLTVVGYAPGGALVVESIKRTVIVGYLSVHLQCPADIVVTDPVGRSIGKYVNEIPNAVYTEADLDENGDPEKFIEILAPIDGNYVLTLNGTGLGLYSMIAQCATSQEVVSFNATIPVSPAVTHEYTINWTALSQNEDGVIVNVDSNGDGVFEYSFASDSELSRVEYVAATTRHDLGITEISTAKSIIGQGFSLPVNITVMNYGPYAETFNVTIYANTTLVTTQIITLANGSFTTVNHVWNTTGFAKGNYTINALVDTLPGETHTVDNTLTNGAFLITIPGDTNGDFKVSLQDLTLLANAYGSKTNDSRWNPNADIDNNGKVELRDLTLLAIHYGQHYP
jgi:hypothetical protein